MELKYWLSAIIVALTQIGVLIYFLAVLKTQIKNLVKEIAEMNAKIKEIIQGYVTRELLDEKLKRIHLRIDETVKDIGEIENNCKRRHPGT